MSWDSRFSDILFSITSKVQNVLLVKNSSLFSFSNMLKRKCRLSLPGALFINSVTNRCTNNTSSAFQKQPPEAFCKKRCSFLKKALAQVFSCGLGEISKNTFFTEHLRVTASGFQLTARHSYGLFTFKWFFVLTSLFHTNWLPSCMNINWGYLTSQANRVKACTSAIVL